MIMSIHTKAANSVLFVIFLFTQISHFNGTVVQTPAFACEGETVTVSCQLSLPNSVDEFDSSRTDFIIGGDDTNIPEAFIGRNYVINGIDMSRFTANAPAGNHTYVTGSITLLSFTSSDVNLRMGCAIEYISSEGTFAPFIQTLALTQAAPSPPTSLQSSVSNFNTATCSADISLSWNTPPSDRNVDRYFLYLDGSPLVTTNSNSYIHSIILNINTDYQYSVTAMSCAGNSTSNMINFVSSYSLMQSSQCVCLDYNSVTGQFTINWRLVTPTQPSGVSGLDITYSLQLLYSHSRQGVTYTYTDSTSFTLPSSQFSYNTVLTAHNFTQLDGVETNITANLMIVQQCGQSFNGTAMEYFLDSSLNGNPETQLIVLSSNCSEPGSLFFDKTRKLLYQCDGTNLTYKCIGTVSTETCAGLGLLGDEEPGYAALEFALDNAALRQSTEEVTYVPLFLFVSDEESVDYSDSKFVKIMEKFRQRSSSVLEFILNPRSFNASGLDNIFGVSYSNNRDLNVWSYNATQTDQSTVAIGSVQAYPRDSTSHREIKRDYIDLAMCTQKASTHVWKMEPFLSEDSNIVNNVSDAFMLQSIETVIEQGVTFTCQQCYCDAIGSINCMQLEGKIICDCLDSGVDKRCPCVRQQVQSLLEGVSNMTIPMIELACGIAATPVGIDVCRQFIVGPIAP